MNKKGQIIQALFFITIVLIVGSTMFIYAKDYANDETFSKNIAVNELKLTKDVLESFEGNVIYDFHMNLFANEVNIYHDYVQIDKARRSFFSPIEVEVKSNNTNISFGKIAGKFRLDNHISENLLNLIEYVDINTRDIHSVELKLIDKDDLNLKAVINELERSLKKKSGFKVNTNVEGSITIFLVSTDRTKNLAQASFALDKNEIIQTKSRKLGALILNQLLLDHDVDIAIKPKNVDVDLDQSRVAVIIEIEKDILKKNWLTIPRSFEMAIDEYYAG
ncbi:MAG: hypothetical protein U9R08_05520 [Nanoarchaeota archaeon]|nr:hypothetical protein [Nanoarchaeota archaeon]